MSVMSWGSGSVWNGAFGHLVRTDESEVGIRQSVLAVHATFLTSVQGSSFFLLAPLPRSRMSPGQLLVDFFRRLQDRCGRAAVASAHLRYPARPARSGVNTTLEWD